MPTTVPATASGGQAKRKRDDEDEEDAWSEYNGKANFRKKDVRRVRVAPNVIKIPAWAFWGCINLVEVDLCNVTEIGGSAFCGCDKLSEADLAKIVSIGSNAFEFCRSLKSIDIPPSVKEIGEEVFMHCSDLLSVELATGLQSIGSQAFSGCSSLRSINIPFSVSEIGWGAFANCTSLTRLELTEGLQTIGAYAFCDCSSLEQIRIPSFVTEVGRNAFADCSNLMSVELAKGIRSVGVSAFKGCSLLESINIPSTVTQIGGSAFHECTSLTSVKLAEGLLTIESRAFQYCYSLERISIPSTVTTIGEGAFSECHSLEHITIPSSVTKIGRTVFWRCKSLSSVELCEGLQTMGVGTFASCTSLTSVKLAEGLLTIGANAFSGCSSLETISIPSSVTEIGEDAFSYCTRLTRVELPEGLLTIGDGAFIHCKSLNGINIPSPAFFISARTFSSTESPLICRLEMNGRAPHTVRMVLSKHVRNMSRHQLVEAESKINTILGRKQKENEKLMSIHELCAALLQEQSKARPPHTQTHAQLQQQIQSQRQVVPAGQQDLLMLATLRKEIQQERNEKDALRRQLEEANTKLALAKSPEIVDLTEDRPEPSTDATGQGPNQNGTSNSPEQPKSALACMQIKQEAVLAKEAAEGRALLAEERIAAVEKEVEALRKAADENAVVRHGQKESLLRNLALHNAELRQSSIHGIGVFALAPIQRGTKLFLLNGRPTFRTCGLSAEEIGSLPNHVQHILRKFILPDEEGLYHVPEHGLSCALGVSYYLNSAVGTGREPNVEFGSELDWSGLAEMVATRHIGKDEELLLSYKVNE